MEEILRTLQLQIQTYAPRILSALILLVLAWVVAAIVRTIITRVLTTAKVDQRFGGRVEPGVPQVPLAKLIGNTVFWLVILFFLPAILEALALPALLLPVQGLITRLINFLPNLFAAILIFVVGLLVARIVRQAVTGVLIAVGVDRLSERAGIAPTLGRQRLSSLLGMIVYFLIFVPVLIAALNALEIAAITAPASAMLNAILLALPAIVAAIVMLAIAYVVARVVAELMTDLLAAAGFNMILPRLGLGKQPAAGQRTPSEIVGYLLLVAIMLFTSIEALRLVGFFALAALLTEFLVLAGQIILGLIVFAVGLYLANLAFNAIQSSGAAQANVLAWVARVAILVLAGGIALRQMGLANEIVNMAFGLLLGAIAVATAIAFGLGGRDTAARLLEDWRRSVEPGEPGSEAPRPPAVQR